MKLLVVEDDPHIRAYLCEALQEQMFTVDVSENGTKGSFAARTNEYDCIILDYMMPGKTGDEVCREVRKSGVVSPIILLSVRNDVHDKIALLNSGADDYLTKPFSFEELVARIRALARRPQILENNILTVDDLVLDVLKQRVTRNAKAIYLTRKEFALLEYMMKHKGNVVSRGMIMEHVWTADMNPFSNTIEAHIMNLRRKIDGSPNSEKRRLIHSVPGRGYKIDTQKL